MKAIFIGALLVFFCGSVSAQQCVFFTYDSYGNRTAKNAALCPNYKQQLPDTVAGKENIANPDSVGYANAASTRKQNGVANMANDPAVSGAAVMVYPNPTRDVLHIVGLKDTQNKRLVIRSATDGKLIRKWRQNAPSRIGVEDLSPGLYLLEIVGNTYKETFIFEKL